MSTAFLQADEYPDDMQARYVSYKPHKYAQVEYYRLKGCLYGQRSAGMEWYKTLRSWLTSEEMGFVPGHNEPCAFMHPTTGLKIAVVVDDILCRGSPEATTEFYKALGQRFDCKDPTYLSDASPIKYVGFDIQQNRCKNRQFWS